MIRTMPALRLASLSPRIGSECCQAISGVSSANFTKRPMYHLSSTTLGMRSPPVPLRSRGMSSWAIPTADFGKQKVTKGLGRLVDGVMVRGEGSYVTFADGRRMLDFTCGIGVTNLGHCHPRVSTAAAEQCHTLVHGQCSIAFTAPYLRLIEKLIPIMPHPSLDSFFFSNTGAEAIEGAIKMSRATTGRQNLIAMQGGYHGRTYGSMAVTRSKTIYSEGFAPLMPGVFTMPFPYWHQYCLPPSTDVDDLVRKSLYQLDLLFSQQTAPRDTAAILIEPVLGEGGYVPAPPAFLHGLRDACDKYGILLIVDEVQTGFCRTGRNFFSEYSGVRPDILVMAKGLANGFPLSGVVTSKALSEKLKPGSMGGTYAGNAVSCAAAVAVADVIREEGILQNVQARSRELFAFLNKLRDSPVIQQNILDVRGQGLMVAVEFASPARFSNDVVAKSSAPKSFASRVAKRCGEKGMLILPTSVYEVIRFIPPLNITEADLRKGCEIFEEAVEEIVREG